MNTPFSRTLRAVRTDSATGYVIAILGAVVTLCVAGLWLFFGSADVYASSTKCFFSAATYAHPLAPQVSGMVTEVHAVLGTHVAVGDILVALDARSQLAQRVEEQVHNDATTRLVAALNNQITVQQRARIAAQGALAASTEAGRARVGVARANLEYSTRRAEVIGKLREKELVAGLDSLQGESERTVNTAQARAQETEAIATTRTGRTNLLDRDVQIASLQRDLAVAEGDLATSNARLAQIDVEIERRRIRAPVSGVVADMTTLAPGATIQAGDRVGTVVPLEPIRIIAEFNPEDAVGRVQVGQPVIIRVDQYPWTQYGTLSGRVVGVGSESHADLVRVDVDLTDSTARIPAVDGLTGNAEVRLGRMKPYQLLLRLAGQLAAHPTTPALKGS